MGPPSFLLVVFLLAAGLFVHALLPAFAAPGEEDPPIQKNEWIALQQTAQSPTGEEQNNNWTDQHLRGVAFLDPQNGWAVGDGVAQESEAKGALILRTTDGGRTWLEEASNTSSDGGRSGLRNRLDDIVFPTSDLAYAVGQRNMSGSAQQVVLVGTVMRNAGRITEIDWGDPKFTLEGPGGQSVSLRAISCSGRHHCFAVGNPDTVVVTKDGWESHTTKQTGLIDGSVGHVTGVALLDGPGSAACAPGCWGYVALNDGVIATRDGGETWNRQLPPQEAPAQSPGRVCGQDCQNDLWFADHLRGYALSGGNIFSTTDGGDNWIIQVFPGRNPGLRSIACASASTCWAVGAEGTIVFTNDRGKNWHRCDESTQACLNNTGVSSQLNEVSVSSDPLTGQTMVYAVGDNGVILKMVTNISGTLHSLNDISCVDRTNCYAVGREGAVLATSDGGRSWETREIPPTKIPNPALLGDQKTPLEGVSFTDKERGHAVGERVILATTDGGKSWQTQSFPPIDLRQDNTFFTNPPERLNDVEFVDGPNCESQGAEAGFQKGCYGFAVGNRGVVMATEDGGQTWTSQISSTASELKTVSFSNHQLGYAAGQTSVLSTSDGESWTPDPAVENLNTDVSDVFLASTGDLYAVGNGGEILVKKPGRSPGWQLQREGKDDTHLSGISFADPSHGIAVGWEAPPSSSVKALVLITRDGGENWTRFAHGLPNEGTDMTLAEVSFTKSRTTGAGTAFAVGSEGAVIKLPPVQVSLPQLPSINSVSPASGPAATETPVQITGANLGGATKVSFGSVDVIPANVTDSELQVQAPPQKPGTVDVTVTVDEVRSNSLAFTYVGQSQNGPGGGTESGGGAAPTLDGGGGPVTSTAPPQQQAQVSTATGTGAATVKPRPASTGGAPASGSNGQIVLEPAPPPAAPPAPGGQGPFSQFSPLASEPITTTPRPGGHEIPWWLTSLAGLGGFSAIVHLGMLAMLLMNRYRPKRPADPKENR